MVLYAICRRNKNREGLRGSELTNISSDQLLPHLAVTTSNQRTLNSYVDLTHFGVKRDAQFVLTIEPDKAQNVVGISVQVGGREYPMEIPQNCPTFNRHLNDVYNETLIKGKVAEVKKRIDNETAPYLREIRRS